jgi:hypothetical protein
MIFIISNNDVRLYNSSGKVAKRVQSEDPFPFESFDFFISGYPSAGFGLARDTSNNKQHVKVAKSVYCGEPIGRWSNTKDGAKMVALPVDTKPAEAIL